MISIHIDQKQAPGLQDKIEKFFNGGCNECLFSGDGKCKLLGFDISGNWDGAKLLACPIIGMEGVDDDKLYLQPEKTGV